MTQVQNSYDPTWHNLTRSQDGLGHGLTTVYDSEFHVFVSTQSNDLSQTTTTTYPPADVVQRALGLASQTTDANNQVASYTYDGFGRPLTVNRPLGHASVDEQWVYTDYSSPASPRRVLHKLYFSYDALNRLTNGVTSGGSSGAYNESYGYADNAGGKAGNLTSKTGLGNYTYGVQAADCPEGVLSKPHAVVTAGTYTYCYDQNGNMRRRTIGTSIYTLSYDAENRLTGVSGAATASFVYDGDGGRVKATFGTTTTAYVGGHYEWTGSTSTSKKYYYANGQRIAMRVGGTLSWLLSDQLGSTATVADGNGAETGKLLYKPWGESRYSSGSTPTSFRYTGQREDASIGLYFYNARYYDPVLGRFVQADTIVPQPGNPGSLNRYSYALNNPIKYADPSGHAECAAGDMACWQNEWKWKNRWYNAHGWFDSGNGWTQKGEAVFADEGILDELFAEAGITLEATNAVWTFDRKAKVGSGIARFGQALQGGIAQLRELLGGVTRMILQPGSPVICRGGSVACAPPTLRNKVWVPAGWLDQSSSLWVGTQIVHELAHVIDWHKGFSGRWHGAPLTDYGGCSWTYPCVNRWERWAEAVTVYVYGSDYATALGMTNNEFLVKGQDLADQMNRIGQLLNGWW